MTKTVRNLTKFQEAQLAFALSDKGRFSIATKVEGKRKFRRDAIERCWLAFEREGITEIVWSGNLGSFEFTCKARDYVEFFKCTTDYLYR